MRLCEEYLLRNSLDPKCSRHVRKGFLYFDGGLKLLCIEWANLGPHPGFYEISECVLGRTCTTLRSTRVDWEEYEAHILSWLEGGKNPVFDKTMVFDLTWQYFIRRHEKDIVGLMPLSDIYRTLDEGNDSRLVDCFGLLERISVARPQVAEFWRTRAFDIVSLYCHWMNSF